jgi:hypothetical protein
MLSMCHPLHMPSFACDASGASWCMHGPAEPALAPSDVLHCLQVCQHASGPEALQQACSSSLQFISSFAVQPGLPPPRGPEAVGRLVLQSLGSVDWLAPGCSEAQLEQQLARLVLQVKLAVQSSRSAALLTCHTGELWG